VRNYLQVHSKLDAFTGAAWNNQWGWGKLYYGTNSDPTTQVLSPNGGEVTVIGAYQNLTWNATDVDGVASVDLRLSRDGGFTYTTIATGLPNTGSYAWTVTGPVTNTALLSVVAHDTGNNLGTDISDQVWAIIDQPVGTLLSLFAAEPVADGIQIKWGFSDPAQFRNVTLQRGASEVGPFADIVAEIHQDADFTIALDRDVVSGQTYYYRLAANSATGAALTFGPLAGTAGRPIAEFALGRVAPNPMHDRARVDFSVPRASDVRLSVIDVQGREVTTLASGHFAPGRYQAVWTGSTGRGQAPAGLYFIRLRTPDRDLTSRIVLSR
jgi:hypothetical protein